MPGNKLIKQKSMKSLIFKISLSVLAFICFVFLIINISDKSDLVVVVDKDLDGILSAAKLNGSHLDETIFPILPNQRAIMAAELVRGENVVYFEIKKNKSNQHREYLCKINKINRNCTAEVYISGSGAKCFDCVSD